MTFFVILRPELTIVNLVKGENKGYKWKPGQRVSLIADKHLVSGKYRPLPDVFAGVYISHNIMGRGGNGAGEKMKNEAVRNKMKKKEKGEGKKKRRKRGRVIFLLIYGTLLMIIVY